MEFIRLKRLVGQTCGVTLSQATSIIKEGRVKVNGQDSHALTLVGETDEVTLDGEIISNRIEPTYVLFHKPRGIECTMNENIADNLLTVFNHPLRLYPVGRLDKDSEGLLLMINDGKLYHEIAHADSGKEKEYYVEVHKPVTMEFLSAMRSGVKILRTVTDPCEVIPDEGKDCAFRIVLKQGMNRQIRRMCYNLGFSVHKLVRTRIMHVSLGNLAAGEWRELTAEEIQPLLELRSGGGSFGDFFHRPL
jgi:23S rRNA pseudouridine2604 synthase